MGCRRSPTAHRVLPPNNCSLCSRITAPCLGSRAVTRMRPLSCAVFARHRPPKQPHGGASWTDLLSVPASSTDYDGAEGACCGRGLAPNGHGRHAKRVHQAFDCTFYDGYAHACNELLSPSSAMQLRSLLSFSDAPLLDEQTNWVATLRVNSCWKSTIVSGWALSTTCHGRHTRVLLCCQARYQSSTAARRHPKKGLRESGAWSLLCLQPR